MPRTLVPLVLPVWSFSYPAGSRQSSFAGRSPAAGANQSFCPNRPAPTKLVFAPTGVFEPVWIFFARPDPDKGFGPAGARQSGLKRIFGRDKALGFFRGLKHRQKPQFFHAHSRI